MNDPTPARIRVLEFVRRLGPVTAAGMAEALGTTDVAARQHLAALEEVGLVQTQSLPVSGPGRPAVGWTATDAARAHLPDGHAELTVGLLDAIEDAVGEPGLGRVIEARGVRQINAYRDAMRDAVDLETRVAMLARLRSDEGYMAEARRADDGAWLLIEHHCPICAAAQRCRGLCNVELQVFAAALGDDVLVERVEHLLEEGARCVYRIMARA